jgi:conjugal transfer pilus assembly protein TraV
MRLSHIKRFAALGSLGLLSACASLSANIDSDFSCRAPKGRCAPTSAIDAEALEANDGQQIGNALRPTVTHGVLPSAKAAARTTENILKIVLPAHVDRAGYLRDEAAVYVVITKPRWASERRSVTAHSAKDTARSISRANRREEDAVANPDTPKAPILSAADFAGSDEAVDLGPEPKPNSIPDISSSREGSPLTLREAIAGASLPAIEGFAGIPPARTPHAISIGDNAPSGFPNAAAIEAARRGHRIGDGSQGATVAESETVSVVVNQAKSQGQSNAKRGRPARAANKVEQTPPPPAELDVVTSPDMPVSPALEPRP